MPDPGPFADIRARAYKAAWALENEELLRERKAAYHQAHKEEICARVSAYYREHREERLGYAGAYRKEHTDSARAYQATYQMQHAEELRAQHTAYYASHKDAFRTYYDAHGDKIRARARARRLENLAEERARDKARYQANRASENARNRAYREAHREQIRANAKRHRQTPGCRARCARQKAERRALGAVPATLLESLKLRSGGICPYCFRPIEKGSLDHVIPISSGGTNAPDNLIWCCLSCNHRKRDRSLLSFLILLHERFGCWPTGANCWKPTRMPNQLQETRVETACLYILLSARL
jgi:hypothetical protein